MDVGNEAVHDFLSLGDNGCLKETNFSLLLVNCFFRENELKVNFNM